MAVVSYCGSLSRSMVGTSSTLDSFGSNKPLEYLHMHPRILVYAHSNRTPTVINFIRIEIF